MSGNPSEGLYRAKNHHGPRWLPSTGAKARILTRISRPQGDDYSRGRNGLSPNALDIRVFLFRVRCLHLCLFQLLHIGWGELRVLNRDRELVNSAGEGEWDIVILVI